MAAGTPWRLRDNSALGTGGVLGLPQRGTAENGGLYRYCLEMGTMSPKLNAQRRTRGVSLARKATSSLRHSGPIGQFGEHDAPTVPAEPGSEVLAGIRLKALMRSHKRCRPRRWRLLAARTSCPGPSARSQRHPGRRSTSGRRPVSDRQHRPSQFCRGTATPDVSGPAAP